MNKIVEQYFDAQAAGYQAGWEKWPWAQVRQAEAKAVFSLFAPGEIAGQEIAEFGAGSGYYTRLLLRAAAANIYAVDFSQAMLSHLLKDRVIPVHGDAARVNLGKKFSSMLSAGMLEFMQAPELALANMFNHAQPNAVLVLLLPIPNFWGYLYRCYHKLHGINIHLFTQAQIEKRIANKWRIVASKKCGLFSIAVKLRIVS